MNKLSGDETIRGIVPTLAKPEAYVRGVLGSMSDYRQAVAEPTVTIGATGQGIVPHYRLQPVDETDDILESVTSYWNNVAAYNGRSHARMDWDAFQLKDDHWSSGRMTFTEVQTLLGELRGFKRTHRA